MTFQSILHREKSYLITESSPQFKLGEYLLLREWDPHQGKYTGEELLGYITHLTQPRDYTLGEGMCIISFNLLFLKKEGKMLDMTSGGITYPVIGTWAFKEE